MIRARAKKFRESFQILFRDVQAQIGDTRAMQGLEDEDTMLYTFIQVINVSTSDEHAIRCKEE